MDSSGQTIETQSSLTILPSLNLGAGNQPVPNMINVDLYPAPHIQQVVDLNGPWPWADHSIGRIFSSHNLEHLNDVVHFMREANRVLAIGGTMEIRVPYGWDNAGMSDPTHIRPFFPGTFTAFCVNIDHPDDPRRFNLQEHHSRWDFGFELQGVEYMFRAWVKKLPFWRKYCFVLAEHLINVISEMRVHFKKIK